MRPTALRWLLVVALALCARSAAAGTFVYVHDYGIAIAEGVNQVFGFSLGKGGALEPLPGSPFVGPDAAASVDNLCAGYCQTMAYARRARLLLTTGPGGVTPWRVAEDGALEVVPGAPFAPEPSLYFGVAAAAAEGATFAYVADYRDDGLYGFRVEDDGSLTPLPLRLARPDGRRPARRPSRAARPRRPQHDDGTLASFRIEDDGSLLAAPGSPLAPRRSALLHPRPRRRRAPRLHGRPRRRGRAYLFEVDPLTGALEAGDVNPVDTDLANTGLGFALLRGARRLRPLRSTVSSRRSGAEARSAASRWARRSPSDSFPSPTASRRVAGGSPRRATSSCACSACGAAAPSSSTRRPSAPQRERRPRRRALRDARAAAAASGMLRGGGSPPHAAPPAGPRPARPVRGRGRPRLDPAPRPRRARDLRPDVPRPRRRRRSPPSPTAASRGPPARSRVRVYRARRRPPLPAHRLLPRRRLRDRRASTPTTAPAAPSPTPPAAWSCPVDYRLAPEHRFPGGRRGLLRGAPLGSPSAGAELGVDPRASRSAATARAATSRR